MIDTMTRLIKFAEHFQLDNSSQLNKLQLQARVMYFLLLSKIQQYTFHLRLRVQLPNNIFQEDKLNIQMMLRLLG